MSITETSDEFIGRLQGGYSYEQASEITKIVNSMPTGHKQLHWIDRRTGGTVVFTS